MNSSIFEKLKVIELARFFMGTYNYREVEIKNVEGVFIENRLANYPLIRISNKKYNSTTDFSKDLEIMEKVVDQYEVISSINNVKCLNIFFDGEAIENHGNITSIVIKNNLDIRNNDILMSEYPLLSSNFDLDKVDEMINMQTQSRNQTKSSLNTNTNERKITEMFSLKEINKKTKFTRYFAALFFALNFYITFFIGVDSVTYLFDYSFYGVFFSELGQFYRLATSLFFDNSLIYTIIFVMFFYRFSTYVELKLGTKKLLMLYGIGIVIIVSAMIFVTPSQVSIGSYPILSLATGAYLGTITMPSERDFLKINLASSGSSIAMFILLGALNPTNIIVSGIAFFTGFAAVYALDKKSQKIKTNYVLALLGTVIIMIGTNFIPNQTLNRAINFENEYIKYVSYDNKQKGLEYKKNLDKYYTNLGAVDYDE